MPTTDGLYYLAIGAASVTGLVLIWPRIQPYFEYISLRLIQKRYNVLIDKRKTILFNTFKELPLNSDKERNILELGIGAGANLDFYPSDEDFSLIGSDLHAYGENVIKKKCNENGIKFHSYVKLNAEDLHALKSESVSGVVATLIMCSVPNIDKALSEIKRVLVPGGKYYFIDHVREEESNFRNALQILVHPVQRILGFCNNRRRIHNNIQNAGFSRVDLERFILSNNILFAPMAAHIMGTATK